MSEPSVLISIINWNSAELTLNCVAQLQAQDYSHFEIVVVDNASQSHSVEDLRQKLPDTVHLIESSENGGYAAGHLQAVKFAQEKKFDCFWLLNIDIVLPPDTLSHLVQAYQELGEDAIYGGVPLEEHNSHKTLNEHRIVLHRKFLTTNYREVLFAPDTYIRFGDLFKTSTPIQVTALAGSSMFIPLSVIERYEFMDVRYFMYSEEIDYCFRLAQDGVRCVAVPSAYIFHKSGGTSSNHSRLHEIMLYYSLRNQLIRIKRYQTRITLLRAVLKNLILILSYPFLEGRKGLEKSKFGLLATWHGLQGKLGKTYAPETYIDS